MSLRTPMGAASTANDGSAPRGVLLYGIAADDLVFIPAPSACELARTYWAIACSKTWRELRARMPARAFELLAPEDREVDDDAPHEAYFAMGDGDWPDWPAQMMLAWMPTEIRRRYGTVVHSVLNGDYLELRTEDLDAIVAELQDVRYDCRRNDLIVRIATRNGELLGHSHAPHCALVQIGTQSRSELEWQQITSAATQDSGIKSVYAERPPAR